MKKVVLKLLLEDDRCKQRAMKNVSAVSGVESLSVDFKNKTMTVIGDVDPIDLVSRLRKLYHAEIISVGPKDVKKMGMNSIELQKENKLGSSVKDRESISSLAKERGKNVENKLNKPSYVASIRPPKEQSADIGLVGLEKEAEDEHKADAHEKEADSSIHGTVKESEKKEATLTIPDDGTTGEPKFLPEKANGENMNLGKSVTTVLDSPGRSYESEKMKEGKDWPNKVAEVSGQKKLKFHVNEGCQQKVMKQVISLAGVDSVSVDPQAEELTIVGDVDPLNVARILKKFKDVKIISVGAAKEPEKYRAAKKAVGEKDQKDQVEGLGNYNTANNAHNFYTAYNPHMMKYYDVCSVEEDPKACVIS